MFRKIIVLGVLLGALAFNQANAASSLLVKHSDEKDWKEFSSLENGFSVMLPKLPEHIHQKIDIPKSSLMLEYDTYVSEPSENIVFVISVWNYPSEIDMSHPEVNLQDGFGGMLAALPNSQVQNMKLVDFQGFKALEFQVKSEELYFHGKLILVYNTLYQVFAVYKSSEKDNGSISRFLDSFKILNPEKRKVEMPKKEGKQKENSRAASKKLNV